MSKHNIYVERDVYSSLLFRKYVSMRNGKNITFSQVIKELLK